MSSSPPLSAHDGPYPDAEAPTKTTLTRTVAIIKHHALDHRFDIERRIQEATFEIVKERQMEFDTDSDPEFLIELFGDDAESLAEGPVWVYVLERRRAVEVWNTLMGDSDPEVARKESPNSLRALYGISLEQNGLMGSPDAQMAEVQISSLFASSPPFPTAELHDDRFSTLRSVDSAVLSALQSPTSDPAEYATSNVTSPSSAGRRATMGVNPHFKARALPATHLAPDIKPRTTKAAALRAGLILPESKNRISVAAPRAPLAKERHQQTFANVPGHKRAETISVLSTAAPVVAPRMTKAAALRMGGAAAAAVVAKKPAPVKSSSTFEGVPGHKRRETISVASVAAPTVAPRLNKAASMRASREQQPPSSFMFRGPSAQKTPTLSRSNSASSLSPARPNNLSRPSSQASIKAGTKPPVSRVTSNGSAASNGATATNGTNGANGTNGSEVKPRIVPRPSSISTPSIAPRTNKSAALRAAKKAEEEAAAAAAAAKKARMTRRT